MYDIVFLSYHEADADRHWFDLKALMPRAIRVDGITGLVNAHKKAASLCRTKYFWVVDADNVIIKPEVFDFKWDRRDEHNDRVAVWRARNNVNGLEYGYGGVKLLPRRAVLNVATTVADFTTSISDHFHLMDEIASETIINITPFEAWKAGFRECVKLASGVIKGGDNSEALARLDKWQTNASDVPNYPYVFIGARDGGRYGVKHRHDASALALINDWEWLHDRFDNPTDY